MKKSDFTGIDRKVVEDIKAPIEKFKVIDDFYAFCNERIEKIKRIEIKERIKLRQYYRKLELWKDNPLRMIGSDSIEEIKLKHYKERYYKTLEIRYTMRQEWINYVLNEKNLYTPSIAFMILSAIIKKLKENDDTLPPALNKGALAQTVEQIHNEALNQQNFNVNFEKEYRVNLQKALMADETKNIDNSLNGWIIIPSKTQDPENFQANVHKLQGLSHNNWCTKGYNAEPYLTEGEFHIYMDNGRPELYCRFIGNVIEEIQSKQNNSRIPTQYYVILKKHIKNYQLSDEESQKIIEQKSRQEYLKDFIKHNFLNGIEQASTQEILEALKIKCIKDSDGFLIISHYSSTHSYYTCNNLELDDKKKYKLSFNFSDLGINEQKLFQEIKIIENDANFEYSEIKKFINLESIGGNTVFRYSNIISLGKLASIGGNADFTYSQLTNLDNLQSIGGNADFSFSYLTSLGNLQSIGGNADFSFSYLENLGNLRSIGRNVNFDFSYIEYPAISSLGNLRSIGGNINFMFSYIHDLGNLQYIGGNVDFGYAYIENLNNLECIRGNASFGKVKNLGKLRSIGGSADFSTSEVKSLGNLQSIGCSANFSNSQVKNLGNLQSIGCSANFLGSKIKSLGNLQSIGCSANFLGSKIKNLGNLQSIGGSANFSGSEIKNLGNLQSIGCNANFSGSKIKSLGKLKSIGGNANFLDSKIKSLGNLQSIGGKTVDFSNSQIKNWRSLQSIRKMLSHILKNFFSILKV